MIVAVTGSRTWNLPELLWAVLDTLPIETLIVGDAKGADACAREWARKGNVPREVFEANWNDLGKAAGMLRNIDMLEHGKPELVVAFRRGRISKGTDGMVKETRKRNIPVLTVEVPA